MLREKLQISKADATQSDLVLSISHLFKSFGSNQVLNDFSMNIFKGENVVVLGKSGCGKSVLIKCVIGLLEPDAGSVYVLGNDILSMDHDELDKVRAKVGFLFQSNALYDSMTVRENLEFPLRRHWIQLSKDETLQHVSEVLEDVRLSHTINMMPAELSGGMRKRISLARTLIMKPEMILYDEPTTGLDPITAREIIELIKEVQIKYNASALIITHDMKCVKMADRVVLLYDGRCYVEGRYEELKASRDRNVQQFFE